MVCNLNLSPETMILQSKIQHKVLNQVIRVTSVVALLVAASYLTSCDDDDNNAFPSVQGKWVGDKTELVATVKGFPTPINKVEMTLPAKLTSNKMVLLFIQRMAKKNPVHGCKTMTSFR